MTRRHILVVLMLFIASVGVRAGEIVASPPVPPRLVEARVYYYPERMGRPILVKWWSKGRLVLDRSLVYPGGPERFRLRVRTEGAGSLQACFLDGLSTRFALPPERQRIQGNVKDIYFDVPSEFAPGDIELELGLSSDAGRSVQGPRFRLGRSVL